MAQMNHNSAYVYSVDGCTLWERLRVIRGFLSDRKKALALAEIGLEQMLEKISTKNDKYEKRKLELELPDMESNIEDARNEVTFLEAMEADLAEKAEASRIEGKSDKEMYEINHFLEHETRLANRAKCEILSENRIRPETISELTRCPKALAQVEECGLLQNAELFVAAFPQQKKLLEETNAANL
jgi:hypothetical protein